MSTNVEVDVWVRDLETNEVVRKILSGHFDIEPGQQLEVWVNDQLKHEEVADDEVV